METLQAGLDLRKEAGICARFSSCATMMMKKGKKRERKMHGRVVMDTPLMGIYPETPLKLNNTPPTSPTRSTEGLSLLLLIFVH